MAERQPLLNNVRNEAMSAWDNIKGHYREGAAEFLGTAAFVMFGTGTIASTVLSGGEKGDWIAINFGFGIGLTLACYIAGGVSSAHLNPAVTLTRAIFRGFSWAKVPVYIIGQFLGAFVGALIVYLVYLPSLRHSNHGGYTHETRAIFATYPEPWVGTFGAFFTELVGTFLLVTVVLATSDDDSIAGPDFQPVVVGLALMAIGASVGSQTGFALNPARDFEPRVLMSMTGWGWKVFSARKYYTWFP
ncbi:hypothetical protein BZG36_00091 [Bifiguratus adelaidae]|uniref:Uncharacterized protein n=1 Tax=Bifiguratus adelaidae TaxID=1938954 RepID=A0A261Y9E4_9FUNG|nr:hypothetical protein BZG36_00091 [Bifiguratus adelaidae]